FGEKRELLGAVAAVGFGLLRQRLLAATAMIGAVDTALSAFGSAYLDFAVGNPALYRLMFGPALAVGHSARPTSALAAGAETKTILEGILRRGAISGVFAIDPDDAGAREMGHLAVWSALHGLAMLIIDQKAEVDLPAETLLAGVLQRVLNGILISRS
ncbi:MAG: WHG domain-containing protein, partial [Rhizobiaceae bacterium]|nr:WHG domain-containing protein [Rhizobiaceae bacterium]